MVFTVITNDSSEKSYDWIIEHFESIYGSLKGKVSHCDFEMGLLNALSKKMYV